MKVSKQEITPLKQPPPKGRPSKGNEFKVTAKYNGVLKTMTCKSWSNLTGIKASVIYNRIATHGWSHQDAIDCVPNKISQSEKERLRRKTMRKYGF
jgi:uncharacterized protein YjcR